MFKIGDITAIVVKKENEVEEFAASELKKLFSMLGNDTIHIVDTKPTHKPCIILTSSPRVINANLNNTSKNLSSQAYRVEALQRNIGTRVCQYPLSP